MSLASLMASAARPLEEQAHALVAFLAARDNVLTVQQAATALGELPADPKPAAKELRRRLNALGVDIKHQNTLKALAEARGSTSYLGLADQLRYDLASWSPDSPAVSCERVVLASFAEAADEVCKRVREQYEDDAPYMVLHPYAGYLFVAATSSRTESWWHLLLAPVDAAMTPVAFTNAGALVRFAERLRRLVEGQLGGWLDGTYDVGQSRLDTNDDTRSLALRHEAEFAEQLMTFYPDAHPAELPEEVPAAERWIACEPFTQAQWADFLKRYWAFSRRVGAPLFQWAKDLQVAASKPRFELVAINQTVLEHARLLANMTWDGLWTSFPFDEDGQVIRDLRTGHASLDNVQRVASVLGIDPNDLLSLTRPTPRIPLPHHTDLGMWLSRMDAVVNLNPLDDDFESKKGFAQRLRALCSVPYAERRPWDKQPPAELETLNQEIRFAGWVVCAGMGTRFVKDLPVGWTRPASISILEFDRQEDVLTQGGQLDPDNRLMDIAPERDAVTPEWLARFNKPRFSASDLLRYSDMVHDTIRPEDDEKGRFTSKVFAGIKVFNRDPEKAHSASVRMEALSNLLKDRPIEPWFRKSRDPKEDSVMISEAAFEAAARCELVNVGGTPGFDRHAFYMLCAQYSRK